MMNYQVTDLVLDSVRKALPQTFDSHGHFNVLKVRFPREYQMDINMMSHAKDPERALHALYAKRLGQLKGLTPTRKVFSRNVRGRITSNQEWRQ